MEDNKTQSKLFTEFPPISTKEWEEKIMKDLKGADYDKKLVWKTTEGFNVRPYYRAEDLENIKHLDAMPGEFPYVRGNKKDNNAWDVRQDVNVINAEEANAKAVRALEKGATSIGFVIQKPIASQNEFSKLVKNIQLDKTPINFVAGANASSCLTMLEDEVKAQGLDAAKVTGSVDFSPLGELTTSGNFSAKEDVVFDQTAALVKFAKESLPNVKAITINGHDIHNSGATAVQELAFSLSMANEYLAKLTDKGLAVEDIAPRLQFSFGIGGNYFFEMAKIRAARLLWAKVVDTYGAPKEAAKMTIHAVTSDWNKTIYDPYVNMLRTTTEAMSSAIAGVDSLTVKPFDSSFKCSDEFSERIARNTQIILKEEAYFDKIVDPAAGSYYIENLTNSIAEEAWKLFLEVENKGGYTDAFAARFIQDQIHASAQKRDMNLATKREILLGTNQYPNLEEKVMNDITPCMVKSKLTIKEDIIAEPIRPYRGAEAFELLRLKSEEAATTPKVFMLTYGNLTFRKARAAFSTSFFGCAGFEIMDNFGFETVEEGIQAATDSKAEIVVICSSDEEYAEIVPEIFEKLNGKTQLVLAGYPKDLVAKFTEMGLKNFIHVKSNVLETLQGFQAELGMK